MPPSGGARDGVSEDIEALVDAELTRQLEKRPPKKENERGRKERSVEVTIGEHTSHEGSAIEIEADDGPREGQHRKRPADDRADVEISFEKDDADENESERDDKEAGEEADEEDEEERGEEAEDEKGDEYAPARTRKKGNAKESRRQDKGGRPRKKIGSMLKRISFWIAAYSVMALLYVSFFAYPVAPARLEGFAYTVNEKVYTNFPYTYEKDYVSAAERSVVVVLTIRTISMPDKAYSTGLKYTKKVTEDYLRENYGQEVEVRFAREGKLTVNGHPAVTQEYDVYKTFTIYNPITGRNEQTTQRVASMTMAAWFCNENFQSVVAGFFHPITTEPDIAGSIRCH